MDIEKIDKTKLHEFEKEVCELAKKRLGTNEYGDANVEVLVVDRTRYERIHYDPMPYLHNLDIDNGYQDLIDDTQKIGRASCRERV